MIILWSAKVPWLEGRYNLSHFLLTSKFDGQDQLLYQIFQLQLSLYLQTKVNKILTGILQINGSLVVILDQELVKSHAPEIWVYIQVDLRPRPFKHTRTVKQWIRNSEIFLYLRVRFLGPVKNPCSIKFENTELPKLSEVRICTLLSDLIMPRSQFA